MPGARVMPRQLRGQERLRDSSVLTPQLHQYVLISENPSILPPKKWVKRLLSSAGGGSPSSAGFHRCVFSPGITCSTLSEVAHGGFYPVKKSYEEGDVVHFFCDKHYSVTGFDSIQCYDFGWYPDPPVCEGTLFFVVLLCQILEMSSHLLSGNALWI